MSDLHHLSIVDAARLIERRDLSPVALTQAYLDRAQALDPQVNAFLLQTAERAQPGQAARHSVCAEGYFQHGGDPDDGALAGVHRHGARTGRGERGAAV
jgi:aspartyl-tRNA(Asn)/glutamyl-tRNA(Gln) amidotransferase subunit A